QSNTWEGYTARSKVPDHASRESCTSARAEKAKRDQGSPFGPSSSGRRALSGPTRRGDSEAQRSCRSDGVRGGLAARIPARRRRRSPMMFGYDGDFSAWGWLLMSLSMVAFWALVIAGIVAGVRYFGAAPDRTSGPAPRTPQDVLAERYARGEIEEDEYQ